MILVLGLAGLTTPMGGAGQDVPPDLSPHPSILIEGDADLCDDEDGDGAVGTDDGIVNCATGDGTIDRPFILEGWRIEVNSAIVCSLVGPVPVLYPTCLTPASCTASEFEAGLAVCGITRNLLVRHVEIRITSSANDVVGILVVGSEAVTFKDVAVASPALGIHVGPIEGDAGVERPSNVRFEGFSYTTLWLHDESAEIPRIDEPVMDIIDSDVAIEDSNLDGGGRRRVIEVDASRDQALGRPHNLEILRSFVGNSTAQGLRVTQAAAKVVDNVFQAAGEAGTEVHTNPNDKAGTEGAHILLTSLQFEITGNHFITTGPVGVGVAIETRAPGTVAHNTFEQTGTGRAIALHVGTQLGCATVAHYNEWNGQQVINEDSACFLDARYNWWGNVNGPDQAPISLAQAYGNILYGDWLRAPFDDLPWVHIDLPPSESKVHGRIVVEGEAGTRNEQLVARVEATRIDADWREPIAANGTEDWQLRWDVTEEPRGPAALWVRACSANLCGVPARLDVVVTDEPIPPIALLDVSPRIARVGEAVELDGSRSYSPLSRPITGFHFGLGDGHVLDWSAQPNVSVTYDREGIFVVTLAVVDDMDVSSENPASLQLRIQDESARALHGDSGGVLPGLAGWTALAVAVAAGLRQRRRKGREG